MVVVAQQVLAVVRIGCMPKLSDIFLNLLGDTLVGASGVNPVEARQNQDQIRNQQTNSLADLAGKFDLSQQPGEGSLPLNVPGYGSLYGKPKQISIFPTGYDSSGSPVLGTPTLAQPGSKIVPHRKDVPSKPSPEDTATAKLRAKIALEKPKAYGSLQNTLREYDNMIKEAEAIKGDKSLGTATGFTSFMGSVPGTGAKRVSARLETLKAKTLLNVLSSLKQLSSNGASGFGALSESEGNAIRDSISTLDPKQSTKDLQDSIGRFTTEMQARKDNLQNTFNTTYGDGPQLLGQGGGGSASPSAGGMLGKVKVSNADGSKSFYIDPSKLQEAAQDGFTQQ